MTMRMTVSTCERDGATSVVVTKHKEQQVSTPRNVQVH